MNQSFYKNSTITFIIINIWCVFVFFDYFLSKEEPFREFGPFANFVYTTIFALGCGIFIGILRIYFIFKKQNSKLIDTFPYIFIGLLNLYIFSIWTIVLILKLLKINYIAAIYTSSCLIISTLILLDIFNKRKLNDNQEGNVIT